MKKLLEVKEFDKIACNPEFNSEYNSEYADLPESVFRDFEDFINKIAGDDDLADAVEFLKFTLC